MKNLQAQGQIFVDYTPEEIFDFLCDPNTEAELNPMEQRVDDGERVTRVGDKFQVTLDFAARKVRYAGRCTAHDRPNRLAMQMEGELEGRQEWRLTPREGGTEVHLSVEIVPPAWLPTYLRDETTAKNWANTLIRQTLDNLKRSLETA